MATGLLRVHVRSSTHCEDPSISFLHSRNRFSSFRLPTHQRRRLHDVILFPRTGEHYQKPRAITFPVNSSTSSSNPPASKDEAVSQAKICLSTTLEKSLNNPKLAGKLKKLRQPRFRVEIPVIDDSPDSLVELAREVFQDLPIKRKGSRVQILLLWPNAEVANRAIKSLPSTQIEHMDMSRILDDDDTRAFGQVDLAVVLAPESSQLGVVRTVSEMLYPKPVVLFNPKWAFEEEESFGELSSFVDTFEVIYSFMGLEVKGILSKRKGVVFKCVRDGVLSGERWSVHVEEEGGELKVVSRFKSRPSIGEVENVLYNLMAINSPITKSAKFLKDLVSNVTGKK